MTLHKNLTLQTSPLDIRNNLSWYKKGMIKSVSGMLFCIYYFILGSERRGGGGGGEEGEEVGEGGGMGGGPFIRIWNRKLRALEKILIDFFYFYYLFILSFILILELVMHFIFTIATDVKRGFFCNFDMTHYG